jgi:hypothetical protein
MTRARNPPIARGDSSSARRSDAPNPGRSSYEIYEWQVDHWFGQHLFIGETDTITDLADGFIGAAIGGALLAVWALARYPSRRVPRRLSRRVLSPPSTERRPAGDGLSPGVPDQGITRARCGGVSDRM